MPDDPAQLPLFDDAPPAPATAAPAPDAQRRRGEYVVPRGRAVEHCKSCGASIVWARTAGNKPIPLSLKTVRHDKEGTRWAMPHFIDCKQGKEWSKHGAGATKENDA